MFYETEVRGHIRVHPTLFDEDTELAVMKSLNKQFDGYISKDLGIVMGVLDINDIQEGIIIHGDGAAYYETTFLLLSYKPEFQEVVLGKVSDITDFGAFVTIGPIDGMVHVAQAMDDFVSFSKSNVLTGKESKKVLKVNDLCRTRVIAVSYKEATNPRIGLTMRQHRLGAMGWIEDELKKEAKKKAPAEKKETKKKDTKKKKKKKK